MKKRSGFGFAGRTGQRGAGRIDGNGGSVVGDETWLGWAGRLDQAWALAHGHLLGDGSS